MRHVTRSCAIPLRRIIEVLLGLMLGVPACAAPPRPEPAQAQQLAQAVATPDRLEPPEDLPGPARALLRTRMASHASDMGALMSAIMVLKYDSIRQHANAIVEEPHFAHPMNPDATELNSALPAKFFTYDRELRVMAAALASAAAKQDALLVASAYGKMSEACVKCHATYRGGRRAAEEK
jgi:cytochrome c556